MVNGLKIDEEQFKQFGVAEQNAILFRNTERILKMLEDKELNCKNQLLLCSAEFDKLNKRKLMDKAFAVLSGSIGGFFATLGKGRWW